MDIEYNGEIRRELIDSLIQQLHLSFGRIKPNVPREDLRDMHKEKDAASMVKFIRNSMGLDMKITIGLVKSGGPPKAPAWIIIPPDIPLFGTRKLKKTCIHMYIRKDFFETITFETVVCTLAHEMAHIVLYAIRHPLRGEEVAVDLAAMMLGYRKLFVDGCEYVETKEVEKTLFERIINPFSRTKITKNHFLLGYMKFGEILYAYGMMQAIMERESGKLPR